MAEKEEVKLLGTWASLFSCRIEIALRLKGVPYEFLEEDLTNKSSLLLELNPVHKKVPVFVRNGKPIAESLVILEYIDETWKHHPILPRDPYEKAMARFWAKFIDDKVLPTSLKIFLGTKEEKEEAIEESHELLKIIEEELKGRDFFGGETIGFVDVVAIIIAFWLTRTRDLVGIELISEEKFPEICRWIRKLSEIDVVKECIPPKEKLLEYMRTKLKSGQEHVKH